MVIPFHHQLQQQFKDLQAISLPATMAIQISQIQLEIPATTVITLSIKVTHSNQTLATKLLSVTQPTQLCHINQQHSSHNNNLLATSE